LFKASRKTWFRTAEIDTKCRLMQPVRDREALLVMARDPIPQDSAPEIRTADFDAAIFDLDGVVTRTARVHAAAWKRLFDEYLEGRAREKGEQFRPFDAASDYIRFVDGKPRYDGVRSFLASRNIWVPDGADSDPPDRETVAGLGNRKNRYFHESLQEEGIEVFESTVALIRCLRNHGIRTALVSSSRNARAVLAAGGLQPLFDVCIDGNDLAALGLKGKPAPDLFLAAAARLGVAAERAVVIEDAISGVQAGRAGHFGLVIGVNRANQARALQENGADIVVDDLAALRIVMPDSPAGDQPGSSSSLGHPSGLAELLSGKEAAVFLDYDGTLTPIADRPDLAILSAEMRESVADLASLCTVAVISGRDRADVQKLVGLDNLIYAGSHGFDIAGPHGLKIEHEEGAAYAAAVQQAVRLLQSNLSDIAGTLVEAKKYAVAVHYRQAEPSSLPAIEAVVDRVVAETPGLVKTGGKKVIELRPSVEWDKGKALLWLLAALGMDRTDVLPIYVGDDETDEDALAVVADRGIGIFVGEPSGSTAARYALASPVEVRAFLKTLAGILRGE
jgi:trehalose-phosphatase